MIKALVVVVAVVAAEAGTTHANTARDDRVHPGHARKRVARMLEQGHDVL